MSLSVMNDGHKKYDASAPLANEKRGAFIVLARYISL